MIKTSKIIAIVLIVGITSFAVGMMIGGFEYPPYGFVKNIYKQLLPQKINLKDPVDSHYKEVNVNSLIHIHNESDVFTKRTALINYIWKNPEFSYDTLPTKIEKNISDERFNHLTNLKGIEKITVTMEYNVTSYAYLFVSEKTNNKLVVYHQGHDGDFVQGKTTIQFFLDNNYSVLAFSMPLLEPNNQPIVDLPNFGKLRLTSHDDLKFLESKNFSPIKFFVEPITVSLNYVEKEYHFESYNMIGISGGGWTTVLYSAIDPRISKSYPVAGSVPMYLRFNNLKNIGDYEQMVPELYNMTEYLDLYVMASYGNNRGQLQVFNEYDPCCFSGLGFKTYESEVKNIMSNLGIGKFDIFLDETNRNHSISNESLEIILKDMEK